MTPYTLLASQQKRGFNPLMTVSPFLQRVIVPDGSETLMFQNGKFIRVLKPGKHWVWGGNVTINEMDLRETTLTVMGQETLTSDQISIRVSMVLFYRITNPEVAARSVQNYQEHLHLAIQAGIRLAVSSKKLDELLADRDSLAATISTSVKEEAGRIGLEMLRLSTKDLMISGELKQAYADGLKARLEGQAILEKARGETAAIRSLLNATQLMESNPGLYQLRYLQTIDRALAEGKGHTIMLGVAETLKNHLPAREGK